MSGFFGGSGEFPPPPTGLKAAVGAGFPTMNRGANDLCAYGAVRSGPDSGAVKSGTGPGAVASGTTYGAVKSGPHSSTISIRAIALIPREERSRGRLDCAGWECAGGWGKKKGPGMFAVRPSKV